MKNSKTLKALALSLGLAALMAPATMNAQINHGLLQNPYKEQGKQNGALMRRSSGSTYNLTTGQFGGDGGQTGGNYGISIGTMGQDPPAPLGSGLFIMAAAGAAYAFSKKRKNQENN